MGKKAIPIAPLVDDNKRRNTFKKRHLGLMKKVHDISVLCKVKVALVIINEDNKLFPYTINNSIEEVLEQYASIDKEIKEKRLLECKESLKMDIEKVEEAKQAKIQRNNLQKMQVDKGKYVQQNMSLLGAQAIPHQPHILNNINSIVPHQSSNWTTTDSIMAFMHSHGNNINNEGSYSTMHKNGYNINSIVSKATLTNENGTNLINNNINHMHQNEHQSYPFDVEANLLHGNAPNLNFQHEEDRYKVNQHQVDSNIPNTNKLFHQFQYYFDGELQDAYGLHGDTPHQEDILTSSKWENIEFHNEDEEVIAWTSP